MVSAHHDQKENTKHTKSFSKNSKRIGNQLIGFSKQEILQ